MIILLTSTKRYPCLRGLKKNNLCGESTITGEHVKNNRDVRDLLGKSGIKPEALPPEEDIKTLQRRLKSEGKKIAKDVKRIK